MSDTNPEPMPDHFEHSEATRNAAPQPADAAHEAAQTLLPLIDTLVWGESAKDGPKHINRKKSLEGYLAGRSTSPKAVRVSDMAEHFTSSRTLHFCCNPDGPAGLLLIDIDCHKKGDFDDARWFAHWLEKEVFPGLFYEPSTSGRGVHGYIVVEHEGDSAKLVQVAKKLDILLNRLENNEFGIEMVEVKGTPRRWIGQTGTQRLRYGMLGKMPRTLPQRLGEFRRTWRGSMAELEALIQRLAERWDIDLSRQAYRPKHGGSVSGKIISDHDLEELDEDGLYTRLAEFLLFERLDWETTVRRAKGWRTQAVVKPELAETDGYEKTSQTLHGIKLTPDDVAIALLIIHKLSLPGYRNADGSMPTARVRALWRALYQSGDVSRSFNTQRWSVIRDTFAANNVVKVKDCRNSCEPGREAAMRWALHPRLIQLIAEANDSPEETSSAPPLQTTAGQNYPLSEGGLSFVLDSGPQEAPKPGGQERLEMILRPLRKVLRKIKPKKWVPRYYWGKRKWLDEEQRYVHW